jgi:hypothetical protein
MNEIDGFEILGFEPKAKKPLRGPFVFREEGDGWIIVNCDNETIIWTTDREVAQFTYGLMVLAFKHGAKSLNE